jgi:hypothetical protein
MMRAFICCCLLTFIGFLWGAIPDSTMVTMTFDACVQGDENPEHPGPKHTLRYTEYYYPQLEVYSLHHGFAAFGSVETKEVDRQRQLVLRRAGVAYPRDRWGLQFAQDKTRFEATYNVLQRLVNNPWYHDPFMGEYDCLGLSVYHNLGQGKITATGGGDSDHSGMAELILEQTGVQCSGNAYAFFVGRDNRLNGQTLLSGGNLKLTFGPLALTNSAQLEWNQYQAETYFRQMGAVDLVLTRHSELNFLTLSKGNIGYHPGYYECTAATNNNLDGIDLALSGTLRSDHRSLQRSYSVLISKQLLPQWNIGTFFTYARDATENRLLQGGLQVKCSHVW